MAGNAASAAYRLVEALEQRTLFSVAVADGLALDAAKGRGKPPPPVSAPPIRLDLVALHEMGHALGLQHSSDPSSIMYAYYNANYDLNNFANDPAVAALRQIYTAQSVANNSTPWKDSLDSIANNGTINLTYSFTRDGASLDQGSSNTFATFDRIFGAGQWEPIFAAQLNRWAGVSNGELSFSPFDPDGIENNVYAFNTSGTAQADPRFGDIRIAAHGFDGAGKVLAHTYYPPPNGVTAAGDSHYDSAENWVLGSGSSSALVSDSSSGHGAKGSHGSPFTAGLRIGSDQAGAKNDEHDSIFDDSDPLEV